MRVLPLKSLFRAAEMSRWSSLGVAATLVLLLNACAIQKPYRFTAKSITKITYNPKRCAELPDGRYQCKDVIFTVSSIEPEKSR